MKHTFFRLPQALAVQKSALAFITAMVVIAAFWSGTLRSDATPYGDGARIMIFTDFIQGPGTWFKQWDPFRHGGFPVLANPEGFWIPAAFVYRGSPWANLLLNCYIYAHLLLIGWLSWLVARRFDLSPFWAAVAAITMTINQNMIMTEQSARVARMLLGLAFLATIWTLQKPLKEPTRFILLTVAVAVGIAMKFYYAIFILAIIWEKGLLDEHGNYDVRGRFLASTVQTAAIVLTGLLLSGFWTLPLVMHHLDTYINANAIEDTLQFPHTVFSALNIFLPLGLQDAGVIKQNSWPFLSLLLLPALALTFFKSARAKLSVLKGYILTIAFGLIFVTMSVPVIGDLIRDVFNSTPLVCRLRHSLVASQIWSVFLPIGACLLLSSAAGLNEKAQAIKPPTRQRKAILIALTGGALMAMAYGIARNDTSALVASVALGLISLAFTLQPGAEGTRAKVLAFALTATSVALLLPPAFAEKVPGSKQPLHIDNGPLYPRISSVIENDPEPYFRVHRNFGFWMPVLDARVRQGQAFNFYFPVEYAYSLKYMSDAYRLDKTRPHWVDYVDCSKFDATGLRLFSVKYLLCRNRSKAEVLQSGWSKILNEGNITLYRNDRYASGIRVFCQWRPHPMLAPDQARTSVLAAVESDQLLVTGGSDAGSTKSCNAAGDRAILNTDLPGEMTLSVHSEQGGYLLIPDNFHSGWHATVNGKTASVVRGYFAYIAVAVPRGDSLVILTFQDPFLVYGLASTIFGLIVILVVFALSRTGKRLRTA